MSNFYKKRIIKWYLFRDVQGEVSSYEPIALIEFSGSINRAGHSQGHYICDIQVMPSKTWYQTNDNEHPKPIQEEDVTKSPYVILYKRSDD